MGKGVQGGLDTLADERAAEQLKCGRRVGHRGGRVDKWPGLWTGEPVDRWTGRPVDW